MTSIAPEEEMKRRRIIPERTEFVGPPCCLAWDGDCPLGRDEVRLVKLVPVAGRRESGG